MNKKILALLMALVCLVASVLTLTSCANGEENQGTNVNEDGLEHLKDLDFGGADVNFIIAGADADDYHLRSIWVDEEEADDAVNIAILERNKKVQDLLNVNITIPEYKDQNIKSWVGSVLLGGDQTYDIIAARQYDDIQVALDGYILDLNTLDQFGADKYLLWDKEYWATSYIDALSFGGKTFWLTGDLCLRYTGGYFSIFVNSDLYDSILRGTYGSIYDVVRSGNWTLDTLMEMAARCYVDDGDDELDIDDQIGFMYPVNDNTNGLAISAGVEFTKYVDGVPTNNVNANNSTLISFMEKANTLLSSPGVYNFPDPCTYEQYATAMNQFAAGTVVFVSGRLNHAEMYLQEMDRYYVIPCPKLNAEQEQYYTGVHDAINIYGINYHIEEERIVAAAATLEAMEYYSYKDVRPIYYDSFLKYKYTRDNEAAEMIDLMHDNVYTDFVYIWQFSEDMQDLGFFLRRKVASPNISSAIKRNQRMWDEGLEKILDKIEQSSQVE